MAQEQQTSDGAPFVLNVNRGNPLEGLFTPQPQYPKSHSILNPEATPPAPGELNPLKGLFTPQPQYPTPQTLVNPDGRPPDGEVNHLTGLFTPVNQWATPRTLLNPQSEPRHLIPERQFLWGQPEHRDALYREHHLNTYGKDVLIPSAKEQVKPRLGPTDASSSAKKSKDLDNTKRPKLFFESHKSKEKPSSPISEALFLIACSKYDLGLKAVDKILAMHPDDAQAHYVKAIALVKLRRYKDAAAEYRSVLRLQPTVHLGNLARKGLKKIGFES